MNRLLEPDQLLDAFTMLEQELPDMLGAAGWQAIASDYQSNLSVLQYASESTERRRAGAELMDLIKHNKAALDRLAVLLDLVDVRREVLLGIADLAERMRHDADEIKELRRAADESPIRTKYVAMRQDFKGAKSVKRSNIEFELDLFTDYGQLAYLAMGVMNTITGIVARDEEYVALNAILTLIGLAYEAATVEVSEQDASVLWGLVQAGRAAPLDRIRNTTNEEREARWLEPLTEDQIKNSLLSLSVIGCVRKVSGTEDSWRVVEKVRMRR